MSKKRLAVHPSSAGSLLDYGVVVPLDPAQDVWERMKLGWEQQQRSRGLHDVTIKTRRYMIERMRDFCDEYPWEWTPAGLERFMSHLQADPAPLSRGSLRAYQGALRLFCDYLSSPVYEWQEACLSQFGRAPVQVCTPWNTRSHLDEYDASPRRRPLSRMEVRRLFAALDEEVDRRIDRGVKGSLTLLRDLRMLQLTYAFGLRRREAVMLDLADLHVNPSTPGYGAYGALHVRYGKACRGGLPRRRNVVLIPQLESVIPGVRHWVEQGRPFFDRRGATALWLTERGTRVSLDAASRTFVLGRELAGLAPELTMHCLRHSYVTHVLQWGYTERFVQEQVGHRVASSTAIYAAVSDDYKQRQVQRALAELHGRTCDRSTDVEIAGSDVQARDVPHHRPDPTTTGARR